MPILQKKGGFDRTFAHVTLTIANVSRSEDIRQRLMFTALRQQTLLIVLLRLLGFLSYFFHQREIHTLAVEDLLNREDLQFIERLEHIGFELALLFGETRKSLFRPHVH